MLRGFAVECLLKAVFVKRGNRLAVSGVLQRMAGVVSHDLVQPAHKLGLNFTDPEKDVLKRLSLFMTSIGRYPISANWTRTQIQRAYGGGKGSPTYWLSPSDYDTCTSIIVRIKGELSR